MELLNDKGLGTWCHDCWAGARESLRLIIAGVYASEERREKSGVVVHDGDEENNCLTGDDAEWKGGCPGGCLGGCTVTYYSALFEIGFGCAGLG